MKMPKIEDVPGFEWRSKRRASEVMPICHGSLYLNGERVIGSCTKFAARCYIAGYLKRKENEMVSSS